MPPATQNAHGSSLSEDEVLQDPPVVKREGGGIHKLRGELLLQPKGDAHPEEEEEEGARGKEARHSLFQAAASRLEEKPCLSTLVQ